MGPGVNQTDECVTTQVIKPLIALVKESEAAEANTIQKPFYKRSKLFEQEISHFF